jgi:uncharacterized oligopeptide transporter (OPT) family protein
LPISTAEFSKRAVIFIALALTPSLIWQPFDVVLLLTGAVLIGGLPHVVAWPLQDQTAESRRASDHRAVRG